MKQTNYSRNVVLLVIAASLLFCTIGLAENIDPQNNESQYAYGENIGWLNAEVWGRCGPGVEVTDTKLTGYLWAENIGWISLSCENTETCDRVQYGVTNDGSGNLSGYAWSENAGWISFSCENAGNCSGMSYGVKIDQLGKFSGQAWGENIGWVNFGSEGPTPFNVVTLWPVVVGICEGDYENDGNVNEADLGIFVSEFERSDCTEVSTCRSDFDADGDVDGSDLALFAGDFGRTDCPCKANGEVLSGGPDD